MTTETLIQSLRQKGVQLSPEGDQLRVRAPKGTLSPELCNLLRDQKPQVIEALQDEKERVRTLVEKVGAREQFFYLHRHRWKAEEHERRLILLEASHAELDRALAASGHCVEHFGWTVALDGRWYQIGTEPPPIAYTPGEKLLQSLLPMILDVDADLDEASPVLDALAADISATEDAGDLEQLRSLFDEYLAVIASTTSHASQRVAATSKLMIDERVPNGC